MKTVVIYSGDDFVRLSLFHSVKKLVPEVFHYSDLSDFVAHTESLKPDLIVLDTLNTKIQDSDMAAINLMSNRLFILYKQEEVTGIKSLIAQALDQLHFPIQIEAFKDKILSLKEKL